MAKGGFEATSQVSQSLLDLRKTIEGLDPAKASGVRKLLGIIPFGDQLRDYFHRYESAQFHINTILNALYQGQDELRKDNAALEQEKLQLWETMQRLAQYVYVVERLDRFARRRPLSRSRRPTPNAPRHSRTTCCSTSDRSTRIC